jgi:GNAT superfamily N-acetyltransferase
MVTIKYMATTDIKFCKELTDREQWGYLEEDLARLIGYEPRGCFVAWGKKEPVGIITTTSFNAYAFLGSLIVRHDARRKGIGRKLMQQAIQYLIQKGVTTIELDGVFPAVELYRNLGFRDKYLSLRFLRSTDEHLQEHKPSHSVETTVSEIISFDRLKTGLSRERVLKTLLTCRNHAVHTVVGNTLHAYAVVRPRASGVFMIGPFIAENQKAADTLMSEIIQVHAYKPLITGVPAIHSGAAELMLRHGFVYKQPSLRMYRGDRLSYEQHMYSILSPEKG